MFTRVHYRYTDAGNYKFWASVILDGEMSAEDREIVARTLDSGACDGHGFIPQQLGWPHPAEDRLDFPCSDDHCFSELPVDEDGIFEIVSVPLHGEVVRDYVSGWVGNMQRIAGNGGWDVERWAI